MEDAALPLCTPENSKCDAMQSFDLNDTPDPLKVRVMNAHQIEMHKTHADNVITVLFHRAPLERLTHGAKIPDDAGPFFDLADATAPLQVRVINACGVGMEKTAEGLLIAKFHRAPPK